jgi:hypothetical protein
MPATQQISKNVPFIDHTGPKPRPVRQPITYRASTVDRSSQRVLALTQAGHLPLKFAGQPLIVAIQEGDKLTARHPDPGIVGPAVPTIAGESYHPEAGILESSHDLHRLIRGAIVHDDALEVREGLVEDARDGARQERGPVVGRDHDADEGRGGLLHLTRGSGQAYP